MPDPVLVMEGRLTLGLRRVPLALRSEARRIAIVGPSGVGKSTLLRAIAGLASVHGELWVGGARWEGRTGFRPAWERGVGWVPQDPTLLPHRTVRQNLGWTGPSAEAVAEVARSLGIEDLLDRMPRNLSGGERQRVAVGRGLLAARSVLLLDEPFSALDRARRERVTGWLGEVCAARGLPLVLVSHDAADVASLADEVWELNDDGLRRR